MTTVRKISVLAAAVLLTLTLGASVASAQSSDPYVGNTTVQTTPQQPQVLGATASQSPTVEAASTSQGSYLAFTGSDAAMLATAGVLVLATGLGLLAVRRRRLASVA